MEDGVDRGRLGVQLSSRGGRYFLGLECFFFCQHTQSLFRTAVSQVESFITFPVQFACGLPVG
jgi:hypothetical protein